MAITLKKLLILVSSSFLLCSVSTGVKADGPQVLPHLKAHRAMVHNPPATGLLVGNSSDPFEKVNRGVWSFNYDFLDRYALRPVAHGYADYMPQPVRKGIHNFLSNFREINNVVNNALTANLADSGISAGRFLVNSTIGVLGLMDIASDMGMEHKPMTFSTVLGKWNVANGPYLQVPFTGMNTPRSIVGGIVDNLYFPYSELEWYWLAAYFTLNTIDSRADMISQEEVLDKSFDPYVSARDFYLQYQEGLVLGKEGIASEQLKKDAADEKNLEEYLDEIDD